MFVSFAHVFVSFDCLCMFEHGNLIPTFVGICYYTFIYILWYVFICLTIIYMCDSILACFIYVIVYYATFRTFPVPSRLVLMFPLTSPHVRTFDCVFEYCARFCCLGYLRTPHVFYVYILYPCAWYYINTFVPISYCFFNTCTFRYIPYWSTSIFDVFVR